MVNIAGLAKAEVLLALYRNSHTQGLGFLQAVPENSVTVEMCRDMLEKCNYYIDYMFGRVIKVDFTDDNFINERLYDQDCGPGTAERAIQELRDSKK